MPGTEVKFLAEQNKLIVQPRKRGKKTASLGDAWLQKAAGSARTQLATDEIMAMIRGEK